MHEITFASGSETCAAWHLPAAGESFAGPAGRPCVVMAPGFAGTRDNSLLGYAEEFAAAIDPFLRALPRDFRYAVEIRNPDFLHPAYFDCLRASAVAHVFNAWTRMPELGRQIRIPAAFTTDFTVVRALLTRSRSYAEAVARFTPYQAVREENHDARQAMRQIVERAKRERQPSYLFVNNRLEGNAPGTIEAVLDK